MNRAQKSPAPPRGRHATLRRLPEIVAAVAGVALALEWTVQDSVPFLATLYYALPMPLVAAALLVALTACLVRERGAWLTVCAALLTAAVATQRSTAFVTRGGADVVATDHVLRGLLWNTARARAGLGEAIAEIRRHAPDLFVLVEPPVSPVGDPLLLLRERMPEYSFAFHGKRFVVAVRGTTTELTEIEVDGGSAARATVTVRGAEIDLLCIDIGSNPLSFRRAPLARVAHVADSLGAGPALVLGDFNTPRRSGHFAPLRERSTHAFEAAGSGCDATWPEPLPFHALDHVWGRGVQFAACRNESTGLSDHRLVVFSFVP